VAELRARLYVTPPGTSLQLSVLRADSDLTVPVVVGDAPTG
jgi:hypothetical protein